MSNVPAMVERPRRRFKTMALGMSVNVSVWLMSGGRDYFDRGCSYGQRDGDVEDRTFGVGSGLGKAATSGRVVMGLEWGRR